MCQMGKMRHIEGDYDGAFEYWTKAVELRDIESHYHLADLYQKGHGVRKDEKKELHHLEEAAIGGHPAARHNLGALSGIMVGARER
jgi:TPR repeat protein